ncbi:MAG: prephenate dehydrogenase [Bryobacteraceae bacterium]|nr:prephenate dehydrogenase [Bryobacteraceae bacterium]
MQIVAIVGVGLIGGSFGLALRKRGFAGRILGISSPRTLDIAISRGAIDEASTLLEAAEIADVIFLAQPVSVILSSIDQLVPVARRECLVTDAGSTKVQIVAQGAKLPLFVGGHPIAGKERSGIAEADADLFVDRHWILTRSPDDVSLPPLVSEYLGWLKECGARPEFLSASEHDRVLAWTSHLPQLASTALASALHGQISEHQLGIAAGPGLRDFTRLALSPWQVWRDILQTNTGNVQHVLSVYIDKLTEIRDNLQTQRTSEEFTIASEVAEVVRRGLSK